jgi:hypothetical protein
MYRTLQQIKEAANHSRHSHAWFAEDTLAYWETRLFDEVYPTSEGAFFVTSDKGPGTETRVYSVRFCDGQGEIHSVNEAFLTRHGITGITYTMMDNLNNARAAAQRTAAGLNLTHRITNAEQQRTPREQP